MTGGRDPVALDMKSAERTWRAVKSFERSRPDLLGRNEPPVQVPRIYQMVRVDNNSDSVTADIIKAVFVGEDTGFDFDALVVTCNTDAPVIPDDAEEFDVNHAALIEGCVFVGDIFQAMNIGHAWYAIGAAHTAVRGTYDSATASVTLSDCNSVTVPVQTAITGFSLTDGDEYLAEWVRADRVYAVTASGCEEA